MAVTTISQSDDLRTIAKKSDANFKAIMKSMAGSTIPVVGSYMMLDVSPRRVFKKSTWKRVGNVAVTDDVTVPLWKRIA